MFQNVKCFLFAVQKQELCCAAKESQHEREEGEIVSVERRVISDSIRGKPVYKPQGCFYDKPELKTMVIPCDKKQIPAGGDKD